MRNLTLPQRGHDSAKLRSGMFEHLLYLRFVVARLSKSWRGRQCDIGECSRVIMTCQKRSRSHTRGVRSCTALKFGIAPAFPFGQQEPTPIPVTSPPKWLSNIPLVVVRSSYPSCSIYSPTGLSRTMIERTKTCSKRTAPSGFAPDTSITANFSLDGVDTGSVVRSSIPKVNGCDTALMLGWEVAALRLFRCNSFAEQGTVSTLSSMLVVGSEVGLGCRASAAAPRGCRREG